MRSCLLSNFISSENPFLPARESIIIHFVNHQATRFLMEFGCPLDLFFGISKRLRLPIAVSIFHQIYLVLQPFRPMDTDSSMLWAAFTVVFFGFLRCSEFRPTWPDRTFPFTLTCYNLITSKLLLKESKTDPFRETAKLTIAKSNSPVCAVTALRDHFLQPASTHPAAQPLFQFSDGQYLTRSSLTHNLRALQIICGFDSAQYASHSFRIGAAARRELCRPPRLAD